MALLDKIQQKAKDVKKNANKALLNTGLKTIITQLKKHLKKHDPQAAYLLTPSEDGLTVHIIKLSQDGVRVLVSERYECFDAQTFVSGMIQKFGLDKMDLSGFAGETIQEEEHE